MRKWTRGSFVDGQQLAALEKMTGRPFEQWFSPNPRPQAGSGLTEIWQQYHADFTARLLAQIPLGEALFPQLSYGLLAFLMSCPAARPT